MRLPSSSNRPDERTSNRCRLPARWLRRDRKALGLGLGTFDTGDQMAAAQHGALGDGCLPRSERPGTGACAENLAMPLDVASSQILVRVHSRRQLRSAGRLDG